MKTPAWCIRLKLENPNWATEPSWEDLRDIYTYLRSIKNMLERSGRQQRPQNYRNIELRLEYLFSEDGFAKMIRLKETIVLLSKTRLGPEETYKDRLTELGLGRKRQKPSEKEKKGKEYLAQGARLQRCKKWQWRIEQAIKEAIENKWYPMFGTYTVDPKNLPEGCLTRDALWKDTPAWDRFVKKMKTEIAEECGYGRKPAKWPKGESFFKYFAIIEHGASGDHPHVHTIWLCKQIPSKWKVDPNQNSTNQNEIDIRAASALWPHGIQRTTMALFIIGSWFTKNWRIPLDRETKKPKKIGDAGAVSHYISKYLTKGETKKWKHRVKATKNFGVVDLMSKLKMEKSLSILLTLTRRPKEYKVSMKLQEATSCPSSLTREKSKKELLKRLHSMKTLRAQKFLWKELTKRPQQFFTTYIKNVKNGQKPWKKMPEQRYNYYTQMLEEVNATVHCEKRLLTLNNWLCYYQGIQKPCKTFTLMKGEHAI